MRYFPQGGGLIIDVQDTDYVFGSGQIQGAKEINPSADWRNHTPKGEKQRRRVETSECTLFNTIQAAETNQEQAGHGTDLDYAERFNAQYAGATPQGNDPRKAAQSIRDYGLIPESMLPFTDEIETWEEYHTYKGGDEEKCIAAGKQWLKRYEFNYDWVWKGDYSVEDRYKMLREALKYSALGVSVFAWVEKDGLYVKPMGAQDNHWTTLVYIDDQNCPYVFDSYEPYLKKLAPFYDFGFAMRYVVKKKSYEPKEGFFSALWTMLKKLW